MSYHSPDEVEREHLRVLGPDFGPLFHGVYEEVAWIHDKWREYRDLSGTSPERIDLLEEAAARFFGYVQSAIWEDVILHLSRLTDDPGRGMRTTLSIRRLESLVDDSKFKAELAVIISRAVDDCAFARDWRNRFIAHRDLSLAIGSSPTPLKRASRLSIQNAIDSLSTIIVAIYEHYFGGGLDLNFPGGPGDAMDLLRVLQDGVAAGRAREQRFHTGNLIPEDWIPRPAV